MLLSSPPQLLPAISLRRIQTRYLRTHPIAVTGSFRSGIRIACSANLSSTEDNSSSVHNSSSVLHQMQSFDSAPNGQLGFRRGPELGLVSILFVLSMIGSSFISLATISLPALSAFRRLSISADKLSNVVSEEVPGTLSALKLSGLEINDLTSQLKYIRQILSGYQHGRKAHTDNTIPRGGKDNPVVN